MPRSHLLRSIIVCSGPHQAGMCLRASVSSCLNGRLGLQKGCRDRAGWVVCDAGVRRCVVVHLRSTTHPLYMSRLAYFRCARTSDAHLVRGAEARVPGSACWLSVAHARTRPHLGDQHRGRIPIFVSLRLAVFASVCLFKFIVPAGPPEAIPAHIRERSPAVARPKFVAPSASPEWVRNKDIARLLGSVATLIDTPKAGCPIQILRPPNPASGSDLTCGLAFDEI